MVRKLHLFGFGINKFVFMILCQQENELFKETSETVVSSKQFQYRLCLYRFTTRVYFWFRHINNLNEFDGSCNIICIMPKTFVQHSVQKVLFYSPPIKRQGRAFALDVKFEPLSKIFTCEPIIKVYYYVCNCKILSNFRERQIS